MHRLALVLALLVALPGCRPPKLAGRSLGQYRITGTLDANSCAEGHPAPPTLTFHVELREDAATRSGYWKLPDAPMVSGSAQDGRFRFEQRVSVVAVAGDASTGVVGCTLERAELVSVELGPAGNDGGAPDAGPSDPGRSDAGAESSERIRGATSITVTPVAGSDCSPLLLPYGGAFPALPCQLRYALEGERL